MVSYALFNLFLFKYNFHNYLMNINIINKDVIKYFFLFNGVIYYMNTYQNNIFLIFLTNMYY